MKFKNFIYFLSLCSLLLLKSTWIVAQSIGAMTNFNGTLLYTDIAILSNSRIIQASNLQPVSPAINGLLQPTGMSNNGGFLYVCQRNNPTRVYNSAFTNVGNLVITDNLGNPIIADNISFIPNTNPQEAFVLRRGTATQAALGAIHRIRFTTVTTATAIRSFNVSSVANGLPPLGLTFDANNVYITCNNNTNQGQLLTLNATTLTQTVPVCNILGFNPRGIAILNGNLVVTGDNSIINGGSNSGTPTGFIRTIALSTVLAGSCCPDFNDIPVTPFPSCAPFFNSFLINAAGNQLTNILTNGCVIPSIAYNPVAVVRPSLQVTTGSQNIIANSSATITVPFTIANVAASTVVTVRFRRLQLNAAGTTINTVTLPTQNYVGSGSFTYTNTINPPTTSGERYVYEVDLFTGQGINCPTIQGQYTVNITGCLPASEGTLIVGGGSRDILANTAMNINIPITISNIPIGTLVTFGLKRTKFSASNQNLGTVNLPTQSFIFGSVSPTYPDNVPASLAGERYVYEAATFTWQGDVCKKMEGSYTINVKACTGTANISVGSGSTTVPLGTTQVTVPAIVSLNDVNPISTPFDFTVTIRYYDANGFANSYNQTFYQLSNTSFSTTHNLPINISPTQTGRYEIVAVNIWFSNWNNQLCNVSYGSGIYVINVPCTPTLSTTAALATAQPCNLQVDFAMTCRQGTFLVEFYPQNGGTPFSNPALIIQRNLQTQPTGNTINLPLWGLTGTYYVRVITQNPSVVSSNYQTVTIPETTIDLVCDSAQFTNGQVIIPLTFTGIAPSPANPLTVFVNRQPAGQNFTATITGLPYQIIDTNPTSAGVSYQYAVRLQNTCNYTADSCSVTIPSLPICGGDLWGQDDPNDDGTECSTSENPWESPDIWLNPSPNAFNDDTDQAPVVGGTNYVYVRVRNRGTAADAGKLRLYWAAASTGLFWPNNWTNGMCNNGTTPVGGEITTTIVDDNGNVVTNGDITQGVNETRVYRFAWTFPNPNDYANCFYEGEYVQNHHFCLLARIEQPADGVCRTQSLPKETTNLGNNVVCNNNVFWQNITILTKEKGGNGTLQAGVIARTTCVTSSWFTKVAGKEESSNNTDKLYCLPLITKFTWTEAISKNASFFESPAGYLIVNLGQTLYDKWTAQGQQGSGITPYMGSSIRVLESGAYILVDLAPYEAYGLLHWFIPTSPFCNNYTIRLTQTACNSAGFCALMGGETFQLRNFCGSGKGGELPVEEIAGKTNLSADDVTVYPNPTQETVNVNLGKTEAKTVEVAVTDLMGRVIVAPQAYENNGGQLAINMGKLAPGTYLLTLQIGNQKITRKIVKQ